MRVNYTEDESFSGQFDLWQSNCLKSFKSKKGQQELRALRDALLALPEKRLISDLYDDFGNVCAIGAYGLSKGIDLSNWSADDTCHDEVGIAAGMPYRVAWSVVVENDSDYVRHETPEARYIRMLAWVEAKITK